MKGNLKDRFISENSENKIVECLKYIEIKIKVWPITHIIKQQKLNSNFMTKSDILKCKNRVQKLNHRFSIGFSKYSYLQPMSTVRSILVDLLNFSVYHVHLYKLHVS